MDNNNSGNTGGGIVFVGLLTILFVALKLTGFVAWSWWWVLSPLWISFLIFVAVVLIIFLVMMNYKG